jgi:hypothetical protein
MNISGIKLPSQNSIQQWEFQRSNVWPVTIQLQNSIQLSVIRPSVNRQNVVAPGYYGGFLNCVLLARYWLFICHRHVDTKPVITSTNYWHRLVVILAQWKQTADKLLLENIMLQSTHFKMSQFIPFFSYKSILIKTNVLNMTTKLC